MACLALARGGPGRVQTARPRPARADRRPRRPSTPSRARRPRARRSRRERRGRAGAGARLLGRSPRATRGSRSSSRSSTADGERRGRPARRGPRGDGRCSGRPGLPSAWGGDPAVEKVKLWWDGDEGYYVGPPRDEATPRDGRPGCRCGRRTSPSSRSSGPCARSAGSTPPSCSGRSPRQPVTDLLGIPATGPSDTYLAADYSGVLSKMNILAPADGATLDGGGRVSGLAESFEGTVGIRRPRSRRLGRAPRLHHGRRSAAAGSCPGATSWTPSGLARPGDYAHRASTDDPVGIARAATAPEIDTKTITESAQSGPT